MRADTISFSPSTPAASASVGRLDAPQAHTFFRLHDIDTGSSILLVGELAVGDAEHKILLAERSIATGVKDTSLPRMFVSQLTSSV